MIDNASKFYGEKPTGLRRFLRKLEETPGQGVAFVERDVVLDHEIGTVVKKLEGFDNRPVLFTSITDHDMPVLLNLYGCKTRIAMALGLGPDASPIKTQEVFSARLGDAGEAKLAVNAEVQEVVKKGGDVDLASLPIGIHVAEQGGKYISSGVLLARDPVTGSINGGIYRLMVQSNNTMSVSVDPGHDLGRIMKYGKDNNVEIECAIVVGADPIIFLASQAKVHVSRDFYDVAGALRGDGPIEVAKCVTNSLQVPSDAEIVIEGRIIPGKTAAEGPYGEFSYYYGSDPKANFIEVDAITHRQNAIYADIHPVHADHRALWLHPGREVSLLQRLQALVAGIVAVNIPLEGAGMVAIIAMKKTHNGDSRRALLFALASDMFIKHAIIVDDDIDICDPSRVTWAMATRFQGDRDLVVVPNVRGYMEDPSGYYLDDEKKHGKLSTKVGYDATIVLGSDFPEAADHYPAAYRDLDPTDYVVNPIRNFS